MHVYAWDCKVTTCSVAGWGVCLSMGNDTHFETFDLHHSLSVLCDSLSGSVYLQRVIIFHLKTQHMWPFLDLSTPLSIFFLFSSHANVTHFHPLTLHYIPLMRNKPIYHPRWPCQVVYRTLWWSLVACLYVNLTMLTVCNPCYAVYKIT